MAKEITYTGLKELRARFARFPQKYDAGVKKALDASLLVAHEKVRAYPKARPNSGYKRTGLLGRSLGVSQGGRMAGKPDVHKVYKPGGNYEAVFGSSLSYAPQVIGDIGQQQLPWSRYWWRLDQVAASAKPKVFEIFKALAESLAKFLDGRGL